MCAYNFGSTGNSPTELLLAVPLDGGNCNTKQLLGVGHRPIKIPQGKMSKTRCDLG